MRIAGVTIPDTKQLAYALPLIYGIGPSRAREILKTAGVPAIKKGSELTAEEETRDIPIIVLTGSHMNKGVPQLFKQERNVRAFLSKTTPIMDIVWVVKEVLNAK